ncbi:MAG TPA: hypothetical protein VGB70_13135 [Allosphingosinicella sp.]|jgi:hypothetical protein
MTKRQKKAPMLPSLLIDAIIDDIILATDEQILEDEDAIESIGGRAAEEFVSHALKAANIRIGKERFKEAEKALHQHALSKQTDSATISRLRTMYNDNEESFSGLKLSLAARGKRKKMTARDLDSALQDLADLGGVDGILRTDK